MILRVLRFLCFVLLLRFQFLKISRRFEIVENFCIEMTNK